MTGDDTANLAAGLLAVSMTPDMGGPSVSVHLVDAALRRDVTELEVGRNRLAIWNSYELAAGALIEADAPSIRGAGTFVVIAGFGRFGRAVLDAIAHHAAADLPTVYVIDERVEESVVLEHAWHSGINVHHEKKNMLDPALWAQLKSHLLESDALPTPIFICTDNDGSNLRCAFEITRLAGPKSIRLVTRLLHWSPGAKLANSGRARVVEPVNLDDLISRALQTPGRKILPSELEGRARPLARATPAAPSSDSDKAA